MNTWLIFDTAFDFLILAPYTSYCIRDISRLGAKRRRRHSETCEAVSETSGWSPVAITKPRGLSYNWSNYKFILQVSALRLRFLVMISTRINFCKTFSFHLNQYLLLNVTSFLYTAYNPLFFGYEHFVFHRIIVASHYVHRQPNGHLLSSCI